MTENRNPAYDGPMGIFEGYGEEVGVENCSHIAIVSISPTETQCMDCLRIWPKEVGFVSDFPQHDRG